MNAALEAPAGRRRLRLGTPRLRSVPGPPWPRLAPECLAVASLLVVTSLSLADGILGNVVAYERDTSVFYFPLMRWAAQQLGQGHLPLWTPQVFGGYPIFADGEVGLAYPPVLLALLALSPERAFVVLRLAHIWIAAGGMYALARAWRLPRPSAVVAGLVFALGSFLQAQIHHENIVRTAAWLPAILALVECGLRSPTWPGRTMWTALAATALGLAGLSLHSQLLAIDLLTLAGYGALRWGVGPLGGLGDDVVGLGRRAWRVRLPGVARVAVPVVLLGLGLAATQLAPLVELAGFSPRGSGIPYAESAAYSLTTFGLAQVLFPFVFRGPGDVQWGLWTHWESYLYVGVAPLVLAAIALVCARVREVAAWGGVALVGLLLALGQYSPINLHYLLWLLPGLSGLRAPGRFTLIVVLAMAMLAGYGLAWLQAEAQRAAQMGPILPARRRLRWTLAALGGVLVAIVVALPLAHALLAAWPLAVRDTVRAMYLSLPRDTYALDDGDIYAGLLWATDLRNPHTVQALGTLLLVLGALGGWQLARRRAVRLWSGWPMLLAGLTGLDLLLFGWGIHPRAPLSKLGAEPAAVSAIQQLPKLDGAGVPPRLLASPVLNQVAADRLAPFDVQEANGYSSLQFIWHRDLLGRVLYVDDGLLDLWNVRYVLDPAHFGVVSTYKGVDFLPQQALLHAPAGGDIAEQRFAVAPGSTVAEVRLVSALFGAVDVSQGTPAAEIELRDADGNLVAQRELGAGRDVMEWGWDIPSIQPYVQHQRVESAGVAFESGPAPNQRALSFGAIGFEPTSGVSSVGIRVVVPHGELAVYGAAVVAPDGSVQQLLGRTNAKYQQVYADGEIRVLENTHALPRAFVVPTARAAPSVGTALSEMVHQPFDPRRQVILAADSGAPPEVSAASSAAADLDAGRATIVGYSSDEVRVRTSSTSAGFLVLSDTYYPGWTATVDGATAPVWRGDVLFRVVPVPAGEHDVWMRFEPASVKLGLLVSAASFAIVLGLLAASAAGAGRRWRRTTSK